MALTHCRMDAFKTVSNFYIILNACFKGNARVQLAKVTDRNACKPRWRDVAALRDELIADPYSENAYI